MRISWLAPDVIVAARTALQRRGADWSTHFSPGFEVPPPLPDVTIPGWEEVTEHVARAERVTAYLQEHGLEDALREFAASPHAIEVATLAAAAHHVDQLTFELVELVLACDIDDYVFYAPFLRLLVELGGNDHDKVVGAYERFVRAYESAARGRPDAGERLAAIYDGLASVYALAGKLDEAQAIFARRHAEDTADAAVALTASRTFLAAGAIARSIGWIELAIERARALGKDDLANVLAQKQDALRKRMS